MAKKRPTPEILTLSADQLEQLLAKLAAALPADLFGLVEKLLRTLQWMMQALEAKDTSLGRLGRLLFGAKTEKTKQLFPPPAPGLPARRPGQGAGAFSRSPPPLPPGA